MSALQLDYRHCARKRPLFIKHSEVEAVASVARSQLVGTNVDAIALEALCSVSGLKINGVAFELAIDMHNPEIGRAHV